MAKSIIVNRIAFITEMTKQNITCEELSNKAGVGRAAVWKMRSSKPVWRTTANHVAAALGIPVESLLEGVGGEKIS